MNMFDALDTLGGALEPNPPHLVTMPDSLARPAMAPTMPSGRRTYPDIGDILGEWAVPILAEYGEWAEVVVTYLRGGTGFVLVSWEVFPDAVSSYDAIGAYWLDKAWLYGLDRTCVRSVWADGGGEDFSRPHYGPLGAFESEPMRSDVDAFRAEVSR